MEKTEMITGSLPKVFGHYVSLNVLSMIGLSCYILADTVFVAGGVGNSGLAALNLVLPAYSFINGAGLMLGMGGATRYAVLRGEGRDAAADDVFTMTLAMGAALGCLLTLIGIFFTPALARLLGAEGETLSLSVHYLRTILLFSCAFIINNILVCFIRNDGSPQLSMAAMLAGSFSNIVLDYSFIFPMGLGMFGAALATGLAPVVSMLVLSLHFIRRRNHFRLTACTPQTRIVREILTTGLPSFVTEFSSGVIILLFNYTILRLSGTTGVAAYGVISNIALIAVAVFTGIAQGIQPIISVNYGAGRTGRVWRTYAAALLLGAVLGLLFLALGLLEADGIVGIFNREGNVEMDRIASSGIHLYFLAFLFMGANIVTTSLFASINRPGPSFAVSILRGLAAVVIFLLILPPALGMDGVWLTIPAAELTTLFVSGILLYRTKGLKSEKIH